MYVDHQIFPGEQGHEVEPALVTAGTAMLQGLPLLWGEQLREGVVGRARAQVLPAKTEGLRAIAVGEESEVADFDEAEGEDVEQETADKFHHLQTHHLEAFVVPRVPPAEADPILGEAHQSAVGEGQAVGITSQILEYVLGAVQGRLGVDDPLLLVEWIEPGTEPGQRARSTAR